MARECDQQPDAGAGKLLSGSVAGGYFIGEGANGQPNGLTAGLQAFASVGATAHAGGNVAGAPNQSSTAFVLGAFAGGGPFLFYSTAQSAQQMSGPSTTYSFNVGLALTSFGIEVSSFGTGWQGSLSPRIPLVSDGVGIAFSKTTANTKPLTPPRPTECPPPDIVKLGSGG